MRRAALAYLVLVIVAGSAAIAGGDPGDPPAGPPQAVEEPPAGAPVAPRRPSRALGLPHRGRLAGGVQLPATGSHFFSWDPILQRVPNRGWRRWGTDRLVAVVLRVAEDHRLANPGAPRLAIGDLSRRRGGDFGPRFGGLGHLSHQNGLDVDIYYPRRDRLEQAPVTVAQVDRALAQDLVDRFVAAGAERVFVGPRVGLRGRRGVVERLVHHDDHLHLRIEP
ncbi:MAG TPA: penicillin-insensitive murein endopeptidase [Thermoleophilaceae bacterium]|nr:penicillin-insensitive murein endopeptidase [Thermoleophilaceae bacterium]